MHDTNMQSNDRQDCEAFCMNNETKEKSEGMTIICDMNPKKRSMDAFGILCINLEWCLCLSLFLSRLFSPLNPRSYYYSLLCYYSVQRECVMWSMAINFSLFCCHYLLTFYLFCLDIHLLYFFVFSWTDEGEDGNESTKSLIQNITTWIQHAFFFPRFRGGSQVHDKDWQRRVSFFSFLIKWKFFSHSFCYI